MSDKFEHYFGVRIKWRDVDGQNETFAPEFDLVDRAGRVLGTLVITDGGGSITVDGPLTDAELRALAVNVLGPLTDAELRATAPAVEAQYRADGVLTTPKMDPSTSSLQILTYWHHKVHDGDAYSLSAYNSDLDGTDELAIAFTVAAGIEEVHPVIVASNTATSLFEILENPTITNGSGSDISPVNRNRVSDNVSTILSIKAIPVANQANLNPTITVDGTQLFAETLGGNKNQGSGAGANDRDEWVLRPGRTYAVRLTGIGDNGVASLALFYYHTTPDA